MQLGFDFGAGDEVVRVRDQLGEVLGRARDIPRREPVGQLVKSLISSRTYDEVSLVAYEQLIDRRSWAELAGAGVDAVCALIAEVTYPKAKAQWLIEALEILARDDFDISFLASRDVDEALAWLEELPGVGRKVAASTLNFSTLNRPSMVIDSHVLRVLQRFGFVAVGGDIRSAYRLMMTATLGWDADDLAELHVLLKRLGQRICRSNEALCGDCPISRTCRQAAAV